MVQHVLNGPSSDQLHEHCRDHRDLKHQIPGSLPNRAVGPLYVKRPAQDTRRDEEDDWQRRKLHLGQGEPQEAREHRRGPIGATTSYGHLCDGQALPGQHGLDRANEGFLHSDQAPDHVAAPEAPANHLLLNCARKKLQPERQGHRDDTCRHETDLAVLRGDQDACKQVDGHAGHRRKQEANEAAHEGAHEQHGQGKVHKQGDQE
mmetsp:Transcript_61831/g.177968  ORF Transcript_61831/g.177968 Transcript_61831/m.177968 type:complete len:205 (+) Transcript_61831:691-1305(+)